MITRRTFTLASAGALVLPDGVAPVGVLLDVVAGDGVAVGDRQRRRLRRRGADLDEAGRDGHQTPRLVRGLMMLGP